MQFQVNFYLLSRFEAIFLRMRLISDSQVFIELILIMEIETYTLNVAIDLCQIALDGVLTGILNQQHKFLCLLLWFLERKLQVLPFEYA